MKKIIILISFIFCTVAILSQNIWNDREKFRKGPDVQHLSKVYRTVKIGHPEIERIWMLEDIKYVGELDNVIDLKTQEGYGGTGSIISGVNDSTYFNYKASLLVCPTGWRIPRIGEWDTLLGTITPYQRKYMFNSFNGFRGHYFYVKNDSIMKGNSNLIGGYWWALDSIECYTCNAVRFDPEWNYENGYADSGDKMSVRCIKEEEVE